MADLVDRIRSELQVRIRELRPVVREFERLERAAAALTRAGTRSVPKVRSRVSRAPATPRQDDAAGTTGEAAPPTAKRAAGANSQRRRRQATGTQAGPKSAALRRTPAPRGQTRAKVLEALAAAPGSSSAAIAKAAGISPSVAAATISRLVKQGQVRRLDESGYAVTETTNDRPTAAEEAQSNTGAVPKSSSAER
jgi:Winged helix-turn-helix DNA-binding